VSFCDVASLPDHDAVAGKPASSLQSDFAEGQVGDEEAMFVIAVTDRGTQRAVMSLSSSIPVIGPAAHGFTVGRTAPR
jgi:hypothetical protein